MIIVISDTISNDEKFENLMVLKRVCDIKYITDQLNYVFLFKEIDEEGAIDGQYLFEEVLISVKIAAVFTNKITEKLQEITDFHGVRLFAISS